ncbi:MAG: hypothetical protein HGA82_01155, partial [Anaerolineales bacterium]|nr:hypothetical protein [Anaerolineales bacterium]
VPGHPGGGPAGSPAAARAARGRGPGRTVPGGRPAHCHARAGASGDRTEHVQEELGDLLFAIANLSRKLGIEPESALRRANEKFTRRFTEMESRLRGAGRQLADCSLDEMENEWARVKQAERGAGRSPEEGGPSDP